MSQDDLKAKYTLSKARELAHPRQLWQARYSPCGKLLCAAGYDGLVHRWDISGDEPHALAPLTGHNGWVQCLAYAGDCLFSADSWGQLACWTYAEESPSPQWKHDRAHAGWIRGLAISPDQSLVASCGNDSVVRVWSTADGAFLHELPGPGGKVYSVGFHPHGESLVIGDAKGVIRDWGLQSARVVRQLDASPLYRLDRIQECGGVRQLSFDAGGELLLAAGQKTPSGGFATGMPAVLLFDWKTGKQTQEMWYGANDEGYVYDAQFHPAGFVMACASAFPGKGPFWFWQPGQPQPFYVGEGLTNGHSLSLHPQGGPLALLIDVSANGNGRLLKDGKYTGGSAKIVFLKLEGPAEG
jgi:WD40 repeat protein